MARRARTSRAWLRRALILAGLVLLGAFLFFRPVLFPPSQITRRVPLDYVAPFPKQVDFGFEDFLTFAPEELGVPDEHWGARRVVLEKVIRDDETAYDEHGWPVELPDRIRKVYHGDKLTSRMSLRHPDLRLPWDNAYAPWWLYPLLPGFPAPDEPVCPMLYAERFWIIVRWLLSTSGEIPRWLSAACAPWRLEPTFVTYYCYDNSGRLIAEWHKDFEARDTPEQPWAFTGGELFKVRDVRHVYDEDGNEVGEIDYRDGSLYRGRIERKDVAAGTEDTYSLSFSDGQLIVLWLHDPSRPEGYEQGYTAWSATYDAAGKLCADEDGIAGSVTFPQWERDMNTHVNFDPDGRITPDEHGVAIERRFWGSRGQWSARAHYDIDGRLTADPYYDAVELWRYNTLWPFVTSSHYRPDMVISALYFDPHPPGWFGKAEILRLAAVLAGALACGCVLFGLLDWAFGRLAGRRGLESARADVDC